MDILGVKMKDETALILGGVGLVLIYWAGKKTAKAVSDAVELLNPTSSNNIAYRGVNSVGAVISGDENFSLGSWIYDVLNPSQSKELSKGTINLPTTGGGGAFNGKGASGGW